MRTFEELFCEHYHVVPANFVRTMFWRCLHRRALVLAPVILVLNRRYFTPDHDLIIRIGRLATSGDMCDELEEFHCHPLNQGFVRSRLKVRLSGARLCHVRAGVMHHAKSPRAAAVGGIAPRLHKPA